MNEFIFWDNITKKFYDNINTFYDNNEKYKCALVDGKALVHHYSNEYEEDLINPYKEDNTIIPFQYIGLNDIDNNKIFADSSIVEFDYDVVYNVKFRKIKGYFYYCRESISYELKLLMPLEFRGRTYYTLKYSKKMSIKIIDTIQENKLNLIKE